MSDIETPTFDAKPLYEGGSSICWYTPVCSACGDLPVDRERSQTEIWREHLYQVHGAPTLTADAIEERPRAALGPDATEDEIGEWLAKTWISLDQTLTAAEMAQAQRFCERHGWLEAG